MSRDVLQKWFGDEQSDVTPIVVGLLNHTFVVTNSRGRFVLQNLNPVFSPDVNKDIDALTRHLEKKGVFTTRLIPTLEGDLWSMHHEQCWRLLTFVEGDNFNALPGAAHAASAGEVVGRFHVALSDFKHAYHFSRPNAHDTKDHVAKLKRVVSSHFEHDLAPEVDALASQILTHTSALPDFSGLPKRHSHGDLKISNLLFASPPANPTLVDLDTIGLMPWPIEMGDAFRSWCNPRGENTEQVVFDEHLFEASLQGYAQVASSLWSKDEVKMLIEGIRIIPLELSSRFLRDVVEDCYFGYDKSRFSRRADHNLLRAKGQFGVYCDIEKKKAHLERVITKVFA